MLFLRHLPTNLIIATVAAVLFIPFLGQVHLFDWDEINFAESSREMLLTGNYFKVSVNFQPFWEKPPLFFWMQSLSMSVFGVNEFAARFPNAIIGIVTLLVLFNIGTKEYDQRFGIYWVMTYVGSFLPHFYFKSGIIDPYFNLFIFLGIYQLSKITSLHHTKTYPRKRFAFYAGIFIGLAILTKGPVAFLIAFLCVVMYFIIRKSLKAIKFQELIIFTFTAFVVSCLWFGWETIQGGPWFLKEFLIYQIRLFSTQDAGHGGPFFYHFVVLLLGVFPASVYVFKSFRKLYSDNPRQKDLKLWMIISLLVVLILFSIVKTKIVHYSSFCYFPISFLAAYALFKVETHKLFFTNSFNILFAIIGVLIALVLLAFPLLLKFKDYLPVEKLLSDDPFAYANLQADVYWSGWESLIGLFYLLVIIVCIRINNRDFVKGAIVVFFSTMITISLTMLLIVPKIEKYSQAAAIEFFESMKGKDVYVEPMYYKTYAHYFYTERPKDYPVHKANDHGWLLSGEIDRPAYFVTKVGRENDMMNNPGMEKLYEKNGFIFFRRMPVSTSDQAGD
ncbi:MAG: ArnT family glycosyltransferase [Cytophagaceae bacterium]